MLDLHYPITANPSALLIVFTVALCVAHAILLPTLGQDEVKWQYIDYVWLPLALIGLLAAVHHTRLEIASANEALARNRETSAWSQVHYWAENYSREESYLCRKGVRSQYSPPPDVFDAIDRDHNSTCDWFRSIKASLPKLSTDVPPDFSGDSLTPPPPQSGHSGRGPLEAVENFRHALQQFSQERTAVATLRREASPPQLLKILQYVGPFVLAIALAIRITKVTGEVRIKLRKSRGAA